MPPPSAKAWHPGRTEPNQPIDFFCTGCGSICDADAAKNIQPEDFRGSPVNRTRLPAGTGRSRPRGWKLGPSGPVSSHGNLPVRLAPATFQHFLDGRPLSKLAHRFSRRNFSAAMLTSSFGMVHPFHPLHTFHAALHLFLVLNLHIVSYASLCSKSFYHNLI